MIRNAGELVEHVKAAVEQHGATPMTNVLIRLGPDGPLYGVGQMKGLRDERGFALILEATAVLAV